MINKTTFEHAINNFFKSLINHLIVRAVTLSIVNTLLNVLINTLGCDKPKEYLFFKTANLFEKSTWVLYVTPLEHHTVIQDAHILSGSNILYKKSNFREILQTSYNYHH